MPLKVETTTGTVFLPDGDYELVGNFAVHRDIASVIMTEGEPSQIAYDKKLWTLTHVKTGRRVGPRTKSQRNARRAVYALNALAGWGEYPIEDLRKPSAETLDTDGFYWAVHSILMRLNLGE